MKIVFDFIANVAWPFLWGFLASVLKALPVGAVIAVIIMTGYTYYGKSAWTLLAADERNISKAAVKKEFRALRQKAVDACYLHAGKHMRTLCVLPCDAITALSMGTCFRCTKLITFSPAWIFRTVAECCDANGYLWEIAFMHSVGHELGHQFDKCKPSGFSRLKAENKKLFYWLREIQCDIYGTGFIKEQFEEYQDFLLAAVHMKAYEYTKKRGDKETKTHPSWELRKALLAEGHEAITKDVINRVADAAGCTDQAFIQKMCSLYGV